MRAHVDSQQLRWNVFADLPDLNGSWRCAVELHSPEGVTVHACKCITSSKAGQYCTEHYCATDEGNLMDLVDQIPEVDMVCSQARHRHNCDPPDAAAVEQHDHVGGRAFRRRQGAHLKVGNEVT